MLTFQEIISSSPFQYAEIIAGWDGKERSFINTDETVNNFEQPTLLLLPANESNLMQLPDYLSINNTQGVLLYGNDKVEVSSSILDEIETYRKPVLLINESNLTFIQQKIQDLKNLKKSGLFHYVWEQSSHYWLETLNKSGIGGLLHRLRTILGQHLLVLNQHFEMDNANDENRYEDPIETLKSLYYRQRQTKTETLSIIYSKEHTYLLYHLRSNDRPYGFILLQEQPNMMVDIYIEQITYAAQAIIAHFKTKEAMVQVHQSYKQQFLYNLLYNNLESEENLISSGKQWGWDFTKPSQLMVMKLTAKTEVYPFSDNMNAIINKSRAHIQSRFLHCILHPIQGYIVIIIFDSFENTAKNRKKVMVSLADSLQKEITESYPDYQCQIGLGRYYPSNLQLYRSFYEAKVALELGQYGFKQSHVRHFEDIGFPRLLSNIPNHLLHEYYQETLDELLSLDREDTQSYIETLEAYYSSNGDITQTAEKLFVHPNTLRKRLKKVQSLLNADFNQLEDLFKIYIALSIMKMLN